MINENEFPEWTEQEWCDLIENLIQEIRDEFNTISQDRDYWLHQAAEKSKSLASYLESYRQYRKWVDSND